MPDSDGLTYNKYSNDATCDSLFVSPSGAGNVPAHVGSRTPRPESEGDMLGLWLSGGLQGQQETSFWTAAEMDFNSPCLLSYPIGGPTSVSTPDASDVCAFVELPSSPFQVASLGADSCLNGGFVGGGLLPPPFGAGSKLTCNQGPCATEVFWSCCEIDRAVSSWQSNRPPKFDLDGSTGLRDATPDSAPPLANLSALLILLDSTAPGAQVATLAARDPDALSDSPTDENGYRAGSFRFGGSRLSDGEPITPMTNAWPASVFRGAAIPISGLLALVIHYRFGHIHLASNVSGLWKRFDGGNATTFTDGGSSVSGSGSHGTDAVGFIAGLTGLNDDAGSDDDSDGTKTGAEVYTLVLTDGLGEPSRKNLTLNVLVVGCTPACEPEVQWEAVPCSAESNLLCLDRSVLNRPWGLRLLDTPASCVFGTAAIGSSSSRVSECDSCCTDADGVRSLLVVIGAVVVISCLSSCAIMMVSEATRKAAAAVTASCADGDQAGLQRGSRNHRHLHSPPAM